MKGNDIMIQVIGKENCGACMMAKRVLTTKGVEFEYSLLEDKEQKEQEQIIKMAEEQGKMSMPFIIKDGELVSLQEVLR